YGCGSTRPSKESLPAAGAVRPGGKRVGAERRKLKTWRFLSPGQPLMRAGAIVVGTLCLRPRSRGAFAVMAPSGFEEAGLELGQSDRAWRAAAEWAGDPVGQQERGAADPLRDAADRRGGGAARRAGHHRRAADPRSVP